MPDKLVEYKRAQARLPKTNRLWPLYGAGMENLGREGKAIEVPLPTHGPGELLVRHDACGLCFSDIKIIQLGEKHPRIFRDLQKEPVVLGHEVAMTVVGVGENLRDQYQVGDRFVIQADISYKGVGYAYGYMIQGGLSQYGVIDQRILNGDDGNYLLPVQPDTGYAESALTEPWACVIAAYRLQYRTGLKPGGVTWIVGPGGGARSGYSIGAGFDAAGHPGQLMLTRVPPDFDRWLRTRAGELGVQVLDAEDITAPPLQQVDDLVLLDPAPETIEATSPFLAQFGVAAILADAPLSRCVDIDIGRVHYNRWVYVGSRGTDVARAYSDHPVRSTLKPGGRAWFVGAGGPMGRMHVQRAVQMQDGYPSLMVNSDVSDLRLGELCTAFAAEADAKGIQWVCLNPGYKERYATAMAGYRQQGFDDVVMLVPVPAVISEAAQYLAPGGTMNVFAGVGRGTMVNLDLSDVYMKDVRFIGHSASDIEDMQVMLSQVEGGQLSTNRSVAAVGSLDAVRDGLQALVDATFPGKVVIFPNIKSMPLTALPDLQDRLPSVYAKLRDGREWTNDAEEEFLRLMLP